MLHLLKKYLILANCNENFKCYSRKYSMIHRVFVYGTLKRNEPNHYWLRRKENGEATFFSEGVTKYKYPLIIATKYNIPFLLSCPGKGHYVKGEIYTVDDIMLGKLDILEDHPSYYVREVNDIMVDNGETKIPTLIKCWVYFLKNFKAELLQRPMLQEYSSAGDHGLPYLDSENESTPDDLDEVLAKRKT